MLSTRKRPFYSRCETSGSPIDSSCKDYCGKSSGNFSTKVRPTALIYNQEARVSICLIPKVASTTWLGYMAALGRIMNKNICMCLKIFAENINMSRRGDVQGHRLPRPPQGAGLQTAWNSEENLSIVIVRHPYSRLGWLISVVCIELIAELNQDWSFKPDMDMFGYSPTQYFEQLSM